MTLRVSDERVARGRIENLTVYPRASDVPEFPIIRESLV